uniref:Transcriptional regulator, XRE family n=1 Tax=Cyanothece sp. (strain PCC 7425 / ATCC 29141) TaxID=395961 RepID=B8HSZ0_CYAP4
MGTVNLEQIRAEKLAELGAQLKQLRQEKAISLDHVSAKTMIQRRLLQAIEEGRLDQLPEPVYTQGFIRRFADALGLNGTEFARAFPAISTPIAPQSKHWWQRLPSAQLRPIHLYLLYIVVVATAVSGLSYSVNRAADSSAVNTGLTGSTPPPSPGVGPKQSPLLTTTAPRTTVLPSSQPTATPTPATPTQTEPAVKVGISLRQESWMEVIVDGQRVYEGILASGTQRTWTAKQKLVVRAGNAGGVMVAVNGTQPKPMGASGAVEEAVFASPVTQTNLSSSTPSSAVQ